LSWNKFADAELTIKLKNNKLVFVFYSVSTTVGGGFNINFRVTIDQLELKNSRSSTSNNDRETTAVG